MQKADDTHPISRRHALSVIAGAAATLAGCSRTQASGSDKSANNAPALGIQLYTVRSLMTRDADGTLAALRQIGYREVELAGLYGATPIAFRAMLDRHGLSAPSTHVGLDALRSNLPRVIDDAKTLGNHWIICPWIDAKERTPDGYRALADEFNRLGAEVAKAGMRFGYHNHAFEWDLLPDGQRGFDILFQNTDPSVVDFELDVFWAKKAGYDALTYLDRKPDRFPLIHAKDMDAAGKMVDVGQGTLDFRGIMRRIRPAGVRHVFVEHDQPASPLESARVSYTALREILER